MFNGIFVNQNKIKVLYSTTWFKLLCRDSILPTVIVVVASRQAPIDVSTVKGCYYLKEIDRPMATNWISY